MPKFKVYVDADKKFWYDCHVVKDVKAVQRMWDTTPGVARDDTTKAAAFCARFTVLKYKKGQKRGKKLGVLGAIILPRVCHQYSRAELIAHECTHAAMGVLERVKMKKYLAGRSKRTGLVNDTEELLAFCTGYMTAQITAWFTKNR